MTVAAIVQARMGSSRLPGKVLEDIAGMPMLAHVLKRVRAIPGVEQVVLATTALKDDDVLVSIAEECGALWYRGSEDDVLDRYYQAAIANAVTTVVRVTADCPLLDPEVSGRVLARFGQGDVDYVSNTRPPMYPDGLDTEVFSFNVLERAWGEATLPSAREHVTPYIWGNEEKFRQANVSNDVDLSHMRWTVDEPQDLGFVRDVCRHLEGNVLKARMADVLLVLERHPEISGTNAGQKRNEGLDRSLMEDEMHVKKAVEGR